MAVAKIQNVRYTVESLYQWDLGQILEIRGLSLPTVHEIHFINEAMSEALVQDAIMGDDGVITAEIPDSLLWDPYKIMAYICTREDESVRTLYCLEIPVKARPKPGSYIGNALNTLPDAAITIVNNHEKSCVFRYMAETVNIASGETKTFNLKVGNMFIVRLVADASYSTQAVPNVKMSIEGGEYYKSLDATVMSGSINRYWYNFYVTATDKIVNITMS